MFIMLMISVFMIAALIMIRTRLVKIGLNKINDCKMFVHALSFLLYALVAAFSSFVNQYYFHWLILLIFADASFACLFFVLWDLGSRNSVGSKEADGNSTEEEDVSAQVDPEVEQQSAIKRMAGTDTLNERFKPEVRRRASIDRVERLMSQQN